MGLIAKLLGQRDQSPENPSTPWDVVAEAFGSQIGTAAGINISETKAMRLSAVFACVRVIAETIASVPLIVYQRGTDDSRTRAFDHPLYRTLHDQANPRMNAFIWREASMIHVLLWGNAYSVIDDRPDGQTYLWPLQPQYVQVTGGADQLTYTYRPPGRGETRFAADEILHVKGLGFDGLVGQSVVGFARNSIALGLATEEFGARWFGNGARPGGVIQYPGRLSDTASSRLRSSFEERHGGVGGAHRVALLEEGAVFNQIGIAPNDSQFLETRQFQVPEICRWFRMPPHKIAHLLQATFSNIEQQGIEFVTDTIQPWALRWEQALVESLFGGAPYYPEFMLDGLQRGDQAARYSAYAIGRQWGWLSANDVRARENMNPVEGGDEYMVPLNMVPAATPAKPTLPAGGPASTPPTQQPPSVKALRADPAQQAEPRRRLRSSYEPLFRDKLHGLLEGERKDVISNAKRIMGSRELTSMLAWLDEFYQGHRQQVQDVMAPVYASYGAEVTAAAAEEVAGQPIELSALLGAYGTSFAARYAAYHQQALAAAASKALQTGGGPRDVVAALGGIFGNWKQGRVSSLAQEETVRAGDTVAKSTWKDNGIRQLRWVAEGGGCVYCSALNGQVVGIDDHFLQSGEAFQPEGAASPLSPSTEVGHAPAHRGCACSVVPEAP